MNPQTGIVRKSSIEELCGHRARALALYQQVADTLTAAKQAHARACVGKSTINAPGTNLLRWEDAESYLKAARENIDRDMWRAFLVNTPLGSLMDVKERKAFEEALHDPAECTPETVFATMDRLRAESGLIFRRGLVNAFSTLSRDYRSHDGFKVGPRVVLEYVISAERFGSGPKWWVRLHSGAEERLRDIDRVMHVLDGKHGPEYSQGLCQAMREAMQMEGQRWEVTTPYFRVKWFRNGNAHLHFLRDDLLLKANRLIAEHYGMAVGAAPDVAEKRGAAAPPPDPALQDFYPTPGGVVQQMVDLAAIEPHHLVLEPSAGEGAIARAVGAPSGRLTMYEAHPGRAEILRSGWPGATVLEGDFLSAVAKPVFHRVIMNPPFHRGVDVLHVAHALDFLAPGGRLVAIMSLGICFRQDAKTAALRERLRAMGARFKPLPAGAFKEAGTGVNTTLVVVNAP